MKKLILFLLLFTNICLGQVIFNNPITGTNPGSTNPYTTGQTFDTNISVNGIGRGPGLTNTAANNRYNAANWNTTTFDSTDYFEFVLTPNSTYTISFINLTYNAQRSGTGPTNFALRSSLDGFTSNISTSSVLTTTTTISKSISLSNITYQNVTSSIIFRIYGWGSTANPGTFSINDFTFNGTICSNLTSTWNGSWSTPPNGNSAIINSNYDTSINGSFEACSLIINSPYILTIGTNTYVKIQNDITNNGTINVDDDGSIVQVNDNSINTGNIIYNRTVSSLRGYDYIYWSSPVNSQTLSSLYSTPSPGFQYQWNPTILNTNNTYGNWESITQPMTPGRGYIMRSSSSFGWTGTLTSQFVGIPNNGIINYTASGINSPITNYRWNLVGNPYPSSIRALSFLTLNNNIDGFVNIWTHGTAPVSTTNPYYQSFQYNYTSNDYITYNGIGTSSGPTGFNGYIASGQGFFVNLLQASTPSSNIIFNNSMRSEIGIPAYSNSQFYRTSESNNEGRIWLDLLNSNNIPTRLLVGYKEDATVERDRLYDAITTQDFYTTINNDKFIIQGRPDFNENDQVNLGINIPTAGEYKIAIAEVDGILTTQNIYIEDLYSNAIYDIRQSPYIFNSNVGTFNDRFILRYTNSTLGNNDFVINNTIIYNKDNKINIDSDKVIKNVRVYDITGKLLYDNNFNSNNIKFSLECSKQILLVKIKTDDDEIITKKISN